ncbi:Myb-like DNA-binding domain-containing protein [Spironucleus salmonicida]|uniref:Myb-like DNA-binding domain-containing protein n=1 Tax=Spironucleus salmonicida TaxID=348837 RepID=V6LEJ8_9EUKA|nr:Myb-like DNA-binding domain-containing protein [Spironucleus salmonicida]|eukprot:EST42678.1 Myb-like DNA-binding domain-containing protein [Spironucleus salmonicida]
MNITNRSVKQKYQWKQEEKDILLHHAGKYKILGQTINWDEIQQVFPHLTLSQLQTQLNNTIRQRCVKYPNKNHNWSEKEETQLISKYNQCKGDWKKINKKFSNFTHSQLKNKIQRIKRNNPTLLREPNYITPPKTDKQKVQQDNYDRSFSPVFNMDMEELDFPGQLDQQTIEYIERMVK